MIDFFRKYVSVVALILMGLFLLVSAEYISLAQNAERVAGHFINVGKSIRSFA